MVLFLFQEFNNDFSLTILEDLIVNSNQPFTFVENEYFIKFCTSLNRDFKLVSAKSMSTRFTKSYINYKPCVAGFLDMPGNGKVSFTTDLWTSPNNKAIMAVTSTLLTGNFEMYEILLAFRELLGPHTGENICSSFLDVVYEYHLENKVSHYRTYKCVIYYYCFDFFFTRFWLSQLIMLAAMGFSLRNWRAGRRIGIFRLRLNFGFIAFAT